MTEFSQTYWNDLIEQYRKGTISEQDRFQLEKQALDDPFLFDALEGFSLYQKASESKRRTTKFFTLPRIGIAASLILLVAVVFNLKTNLNTAIEEDQSIAMVLDKEEAAKSEPEVASVTEEPETQKVEDGISSETPPESESKLTSKPKKDVTTSTNVGKKAEAEKAVIEPSQPDKMEEGNLVVEVDLDVNQIPTNNESKKEEEEMTAEDDVVVLDEIVVVKAGDTSVDIANANNFDDLKQENESETVPIGALSEKKEDTLGSISKKKMSLKVYEAVPVIGKTFFDDFAKQKIDERGLRQKQPLEVVIEFKIDNNGNLTDFHHIYSGCPECGAFAIALLTNSGEWKTVPPGFSGRARYAFTF